MANVLNFRHSFILAKFQISNLLIFELRHEISNNMVCATSRASDQPAHMRSLIRAFASHLNILSIFRYWPNSILSV